MYSDHRLGTTVIDAYDIKQNIEIMIINSNHVTVL